MILRDGTGSAVGHTEVYATVYPTITLPIPSALRGAYGETDAQTFVYAANATAFIGSEEI